MTLKNKLLIGATALGLWTAANAQTEETFSCGQSHELAENLNHSLTMRGGEYKRTDCDTIRTYLISILPSPRADNRDMFYEWLQNVVDQTDVKAIQNLGIAQMNWAEMVPWLQANLKTENIHPIFASLVYDQMPIALADTLKNIIENHSPDVIYLEVPSDMPWKNYAVWWPWRGMIIIKSYNSDPMYKAAVGHELGHEMWQWPHDDSMNNIMNSSLSGNTSPLFTEEHKQHINDSYTEHLIATNPDRNCTITGIEDIQLDANSFRVYPNPAVASDITFESITEPMKEVRIYNQLGQLFTYVPRDQHNTHLLQVSLDGLSAGMWYATIVTDKGNTTKSVVVLK